MKRWFCFLLVCWGVVFLLLNPGHQAGVNQLHASCDGSVNCWREFVPTSIRTSEDPSRVRRHLSNMSFTRRSFPNGIRDGGPPRSARATTLQSWAKECLL